MLACNLQTAMDEKCSGGFAQHPWPIALEDGRWGDRFREMGLGRCSLLIVHAQ